MIHWVNPAYDAMANHTYTLQESWELVRFRKWRLTPESEGWIESVDVPKLFITIMMVIQEIEMESHTGESEGRVDSNNFASLVLTSMVGTKDGGEHWKGRAGLSQLDIRSQGYLL